MKTGAVIVAAGMSSRMGEFKPMLKIGALSMCQRIVASFRQAGVSPIVVVTGYRGEELERHLAGAGVDCVRNERYETTRMLDSARIGFSHIACRCDRTFFTPADIPLFAASTLSRLMASRASVAKPVCRGEEGHPILLSCGILPALLGSDWDGGLEQGIRERCGDVELVEVDDEGILRDADTPEDFRRLVELQDRGA